MLPRESHEGENRRRFLPPIPLVRLVRILERWELVDILGA